MTGPAGAHADRGGAEPGDHHELVYLIAAGLAVLLIAMVIVAVTSLTGTESASSAEKARAAKVAKLPPYWTVHTGDSYEKISAKTGLTIEELETFNPYVNPSAIVPGQKIKLRLHPPPPKAKPKGPRTYTVRSGDTFDSIAAKIDHSIVWLTQLNPKVDPTDLHPGDRIKLRK